MNFEHLIEKANIVDYISQFVELEEKRGEFWGLSCFKNEDTPSFSVNEEKQVWKDFSSGKGGNLISFIMDYHKCNFKKAIEILKEFLQIEGDIDYIPPPEIVKILRQYKPKCKRKKEFTRHILPNDVMEKYDKRSISLWEEEGISRDVMEKYQVRYDAHAEIICFPIWDNLGQIINIKGRRVGELWEQLKLKKYMHYYKVGTTDYLYGYYQKKDLIKKKNEVIIFESEKSVMKMDSWGIENSVALGHSELSDEQLVAIVELGVNVVVALDKDKDARKLENLNKLKRFCKVEYIWDRNNLLDPKDAPCDKTLDVWKELYSKKIRLK